MSLWPSGNKMREKLKLFLALEVNNNLKRYF